MIMIVLFFLFEKITRGSIKPVTTNPKSSVTKEAIQKLVVPLSILTLVTINTMIEKWSPGSEDSLGERALELCTGSDT